MLHEKRNAPQYIVLDLIEAALTALGVSVTLGLRTSSPMTAIVFVLAALTYRLLPPARGKKFVWAAGVPALMFACFVVLGDRWHFAALIDSDTIQPDTLSLLSKALTCLCALGLFVGFYRLINALMAALSREPAAAEPLGKKSLRRLFWLSFGVCVLCWIPYYIAFYPGIYTPDSIAQINQALGIDAYNNAHPWVHTLLIKLFITVFGAVFDDMNNIMACYVAAQVLFMAAVYARVLRALAEMGLKKWGLALVLIFYALVPFNGIFAVTVWKDVCFSGVVLLLVVKLWELCRRPRAEKAPVMDWVWLGLLSVVMCLFRNNGFYAFLLLFPCSVIFMKGRRLPAALTLAAALALVLVVRGPVMGAYGVAEPDPIESLAIPAQQIARVVAQGGELTEYETTLLSHLVDLEQVPATYDENIVDPIKRLVRQTGNQMWLEWCTPEYVTIYLSILQRYPTVYVRAWLEMTKGYWYPDLQYWVFANEVAPNIFGLAQQKPLGETYSALVYQWGISYKAAPVYGLLWSIGLYTWCSILCFILALLKRRSILPFIPVIALVGTILIATPVYSEFRYVYSMIVCLPFYIGAVCAPAEVRELNA